MDAGGRGCAQGADGDEHSKRPPSSAAGLWRSSAARVRSLLNVLGHGAPRVAWRSPRHFGLVVSSLCPHMTR